MFRDDFRRLAGLRDSRSLTEARKPQGFIAEATDKTIGIIKKLAKKTKMGDFDIREVHEALNTIDPGWSLEVTVGAMPMKEGPINPKFEDRSIEQDFMAAHGCSWTNFTGYSVTSAGFSYAHGPKIGEYNVPAYAKRTEPPSKQEIDKATKAFLDILLDGIIQQKDPPNPMAGQVYVAPVGKPKVEEGPNPHFQGVNFTSVTFKLSAVKRGVEVVRLTSPKGEVIDVEGKGPGLWTRLYKTDIDKKAQAYIDGEGIVAKDAVKKAMKGYSSNDIVGHCGICQNIQKLRHLQLVLHGYTRPGYGWIQGSCFGVGYKAWELSPESVEAYIKHLDAAIPRQKNHVASTKSIKEVTVLIDDKFLVKGSGQGHRKYTVTKDGFELADEKKYSYAEREKLGIPVAYNVYALDAKNAEKVFGEQKDRIVKAAESHLAQMIQVRKESVQAVANWSKQALPGATHEALEEQKRLMGLR